LERALGRVFQEGETPVTVIRALLRHLHRLHLLAARVNAGEPIDAVLRGARPPIFFKRQENFRRQLGLWREGILRRQLDALADAEAQMKTTGLPAETICRAVMLATARAARRRAG
jgi:DNA polymerase III subunit delta